MRVVKDPPRPEALSSFSLESWDLLPVGIAAVDSRGRQVYVNPEFASMLGWRVSELIGLEPPFPYWPAEEHYRILGALTRTLRGDATSPFELRFSRRDGTPIDVQVSIRTLAAPGGETIHVAAVSDITSRTRAADALLDRERRLAMAVEAGRLGTWVYELGSEEVRWSPMLERIHGLEPGTFGGTFEAYQRDIHPEDRDRVLETIARSARGDHAHELEYRIILPTGEIRWLQARGELVRDTRGQPVRMVGVCADATERKQVEEAIRAAQEAAEAANRAKSEFLARMSHELRTPLNAIGGYAELLAIGVHGATTAAQAEAISRIQLNQHHLSGLIDDLLDFARIDAGGIRLDLEVVAAAEVLEDVMATMSPAAATAEIRLKMEPCPSEIVVTADPQRVRQILLNLVGNALKFTPRGGDVTVGATSTGEAEVEFLVRDTGPGIAEDEQLRIFQPFVQLQSKKRGVGLGLAICRELAHAMSGSLRVDSRPGEGATFVLSLPDASA